jgi:hypothetical protein
MLKKVYYLSIDRDEIFPNAFLFVCSIVGFAFEVEIFSDFFVSMIVERRGEGGRSCFSLS